MPSFRLPLLPALAALAFAVPVVAPAAQSPLVWEELIESPYNSYRSEDVAFVGTQRGWAVSGAEGGKAYRTLDGGETWTRTAELDGYLRSTGFATENRGWIGVLWSSTKLYETLDGGLTYADITARIQPALPNSVGICGMTVVDAQTVYAVGQFNGPAYLIRTTDGGATWTSRSMAPLVNELIDVHFFDAQHGLALGAVGSYSNGQSRARVIGTDDGGQTWTVRHTITDVYSLGWKLTFPTRLVGYASVETFDGQPDGYVFKTVDGGQTWTDITIPGGGSLQGIGFATPETGWASGRGVTSRTTDGGLTWEHLSTTGTDRELDGSINRFRFYPDGRGFAAGHKIYRLTGNTSTTDGPGEGADGLDVPSPNPARGPVRIGYRVATVGEVRVDVFDVQGRRVASIVEGTTAPGDHVATWTPQGVAPGLYVVRMQSAAGVWSQSVAVVGR